MTAALPNWAGIGPGSSDAELVLASASGDRGAFAEIYDRYADRLHDFCIGMLRDRDSAADCVQDAFCIVATSLSGLREPDKLRPWLYSICRNEALKRLRELRRERPSDEMPDIASHDASPDTMAHRMELANLISEAAGGLSDRDQAVLELAYRQGLDGPELAMALGVTQTNANTMVGRLRETIERSLGALLVARRIQDDPARCPELAAVLHGWDGKFNILMRKRIARHIESCDACEDERRRSVNPAALLGAPLFIPAPAWLKNSVTRDFELTSASHGMGNNGAATKLGPRVDNSHFPPTLARPAIQPSPPPPPPPPPYAPHDGPALLVGNPAVGESKHRVVPLMALLIFIPLLALGATLAWLYYPAPHSRRAASCNRRRYRHRPRRFRCRPPPQSCRHRSHPMRSRHRVRLPHCRRRKPSPFRRRRRSPSRPRRRRSPRLRHRYRRLRRLLLSRRRRHCLNRSPSLRSDRFRCRRYLSPRTPPGFRRYSLPCRHPLKPRHRHPPKRPNRTRPPRCPSRIPRPRHLHRNRSRSPSVPRPRRSIRRRPRRRATRQRPYACTKPRSYSFALTSCSLRPNSSSCPLNVPWHETTTW